VQVSELNRCRTLEKPTTVISDKKRDVLLQCFLLHFPSIVITIGVLSLTFSSIFWQAPNPDFNSILSALQFAAKVHESLIILSLSAIVLHRIRFDLMGERGVPLGLLSSGYQLSSVSYLFSSELWVGILKPERGRYRGLSTILLLLVAFILAGLSGPSSAITMIPRLDWWPFVGLSSRNRYSFEAYLEAPNQPLFPTLVTMDDVPASCFGKDVDPESDCPSAGFPSLTSSAFFTAQRNYSTSEFHMAVHNITMPIKWSGQQRHVSGGIGHGGVDRPFAATTVSDFIASSLVWYWDQVLIGQFKAAKDPFAIYRAASRPMVRANLDLRVPSLKPQKPLVMVECSGQPRGSQTLDFRHDRGILPPWNSDAFKHADMSIPASQISNITSIDGSGRLNFTWVNLEETAGVTPSIGGIFVLPHNEKLNFIFSCTVDARWLPLHAWIDPSVDSFVHEDLANADDAQLKFAGQDPSSPSLPCIHIDSSWADALNVVSWASGSNLTAMETIGTYCMNTFAPVPDEWDPAFNVAVCLRSAMAMYITDGLSRLGNSIPSYLAKVRHGTDPSARVEIEPLVGYRIVEPYSRNVTYGDLQDPTKYLHLEFPVFRYGYGYGLRGISIYLATIVLLVHVTLALMHIALLLKTGMVSTVWATTGGMLLLAINSMPPRTLHDSAQPEDSQDMTWGKLVRIRETSEDQVGLVFGGGAETEVGPGTISRRVTPGKKYGHSGGTWPMFSG
jgi:hypothetical protein